MNQVVGNQKNIIKTQMNYFSKFTHNVQINVVNYVSIIFSTRECGFRDSQLRLITVPQHTGVP